MDIETLQATAREMMAPRKGLLAADESISTCEKRFASVGIPCTAENRRRYRDMLLGATHAEEYISGVILHDETIRETDVHGTPFPELLASRHIVPGIKVDAGPKTLALHPHEKVTEGLDGLRERLAEYKTMGARFAKWRAVITIGENMPSRACIHANAHALARYAALCQEADMVPIIEPEVLRDGDYTLERSYEVTAAVLKKVFEEMAGQDVAYSGVILKTSMVMAGAFAAQQSSVQEVAQATIRCLRENVPADIAGIAFLSGGQNDEQATEHLNAINRNRGDAPWRLTFSYARALQNQPLALWARDMEKNVAAAREAFLFRAKMNALASSGRYDPSMETSRPQ